MFCVDRIRGRAYVDEHRQTYRQKSWIDVHNIKVSKSLRLGDAHKSRWFENVAQKILSMSCRKKMHKRSNFLTVTAYWAQRN